MREQHMLLPEPPAAATTSAERKRELDPEEEDDTTPAVVGRECTVTVRPIYWKNLRCSGVDQNRTIDGMNVFVI